MKNSILLVLLFITLGINATVPTGDTFQSFCNEESPTIENIVVNGSNIIWFDIDDSSGTQLPLSTLLENGETYFAFDSTDTESGSLSITVQLPIPAPIGDSLISLCAIDNPTLSDLPIFNTSDYDEIYWYSTETQELGTELPYSTTLINGETYYAFQAVCSCDNNDCLGVLPVTIDLIENVPAPIADMDQIFCIQDVPTLEDLLIENTIGYSTIYWVSNTYCQEGQLLDSTTELIDGETYFAYQTPNNGCCPDYKAITVHLENAIPAPIGDENWVFCMNDSFMLSSINLTNTLDFDTIYWFSNNNSFGTPLVPSTITEDGVTYYAFQGIGVCGESLAVTVNFATCLGIDDNKITNFYIRPNPVKDVINLDFNTTNNKSTVVIYNAFGSLIYKKEFYQKNNIAINISNLKTGIYFINTKVDTSISTKKFIKL